MTHTVQLRPIREDDLDEVLRFLWDAETTGEFEWFGHRMDVAGEIKDRFARDGLVSDTEASFLAVEVDGDALAGWVTWRSVGAFGTREIGIALFPGHRGRGVGTAAQRLLVDHLFNTTATNRIQAGTEVDNVAEQRALEAVGFLQEGTQRGLHFRAGRWRDSHMYGLLREDDEGSTR